MYTKVRDMKIKKNINNNVSLCEDSQGRELIAFGKGIGFIKPPCEVPLEKIQRTFYNIPENYLSVMEVIPEEVLDVAMEIYDYARKRIHHGIPSSVVFTLADHIQFAIKRETEHISIQLPMLYEIKNLYPDETVIGSYAVKLINRRFRIRLTREEAASIALHFIGGTKTAQKANKDEKKIVEACTKIVEETMKIQIDTNGFNYSRFLTHLHYLLERVKKNESLDTENEKVYDELKRQYPEAYQCALQIEAYLSVQLKNEEILYLILHINRLCSRENSN